MPAIYKGGKLVEKGDVGKMRPVGGSNSGYQGSIGGGGGGNNQQKNQKDSSSGGISNFIKNFLDKGKAENAITGDNFAADLKKASKFLYTQHPYAQELKNKYNLEDSDIVKLRMGMTQPGFSDKITEVYQEKVSPRLMGQSSFGPANQQMAMDAYQEGMKISDTINPYEKGTFKAGLYDRVQGIPFFAGINALFGSPQGQQAMYFGREELGKEGEDLKKFAASVVNNPNLYYQMMSTPTMQDYEFDQFVYDVRRDLPIGGGGNPVTPVDPDPYDFVEDNPYFN